MIDIPIDMLYLEIGILCGTLKLISIFLIKFILVAFNNIKIKLLLFYLIATFELCILNYEIIAAMEVFEPIRFLVITFIIISVWKKSWVGIDCSPNVLIEYLLTNKNKHYFIVMLIIFIEIFADYLAFKILPVIWYNFGIQRSISCSIKFNKNTMTRAFILEWLLIVTCRLSIYTLTKYKRFLSKESVYAIRNFLVTIYRTAGYFLVGSFNNPVLGVAMRYGCSGINIYENLFVFWIAPISGSLFVLIIKALCKQWMENFKSNLISLRRINLTLSDIAVNNSLLYTSLRSKPRSKPSKGLYYIKVPFTLRRW